MTEVQLDCAGYTVDEVQAAMHSRSLEKHSTLQHEQNAHLECKDTIETVRYVIQCTADGTMRSCRYLDMGG